MKCEYDTRKNCASRMKREQFFSEAHFAMPLPTVNCQLSIVNWTHTFSAKEKDSETGLSYFGSRYYSSDLSIWLSVDPMSDKYPSLSPYTYCANNPIKLVDPNGEEVIIDGSASSWAMTKLSSTYKNLNLSIGKGGKLEAKVDKNSKLTQDEKQLLKAINSEKVSVRLTVNEKNGYKHPLDNNTYPSKEGGAFMGNQLSNDGESVNTYQFASKNILREKYFSSDIGGVLGHEITESFEGGLLSIGMGVSAKPATGDVDKVSNEIYNKSHNLAIECPLMKETQRNIFWSQYGLDYNKIKEYF